MIGDLILGNKPTFQTTDLQKTKFYILQACLNLRAKERMNVCAQNITLFPCPWGYSIYPRFFLHVQFLHLEATCLVPVYEICERVCGTLDALIYIDSVYVVTRQVDVCYQTWGWKESNKGDGAIGSEQGGILLMHPLISPLNNWLISS